MTRRSDAPSLSRGAQVAAAGCRGRVEIVATILLLIFLVRLIDPTLELIELNHPVRTPDLSIPGSVAPVGTLISFGLMVVFLLIRMWRVLTLSGFIGCCIAAGAIVAALEVSARS